MVENHNPSFTTEHLRFLNYIRAVGTGPKGNRPLTYEEAKDAFELIVERRVPDIAITAFLLGWRVQGETPDELQGCIDWLANKSSTFRGEGIEIGYPMDGKAKFPPIMLKAAEWLPELAVHASYDAPLGPKYGFTLDRFESYSPSFKLHERRHQMKGLSHLTDMRNAIGIRTAFNTLEKLNFLAPIALIGMHHAPYFDLYASLYGDHYQRLIIVQGHEGTPEILKKTKFKVVENGEITTHHIDPETFGIEPIAAKETMGLEAMRELMQRPDENLTKMILLNAAFLGWSAGHYRSVEEGYSTLI